MGGPEGLIESCQRVDVEAARIEEKPIGQQFELLVGPVCRLEDRRERRLVPEQGRIKKIDQSVAQVIEAPEIADLGESVVAMPIVRCQH